MENKKHWWQELPLTISAVQCNLGDDDEWGLDEYVSKSGFNTEQLLHLVAKGHIGHYKAPLRQGYGLLHQRQLCGNGCK